LLEQTFESLTAACWLSEERLLQTLETVKRVLFFKKKIELSNKQNGKVSKRKQKVVRRPSAKNFQNLTKRQLKAKLCLAILNKFNLNKFGLQVF
jgi:hypothetical protein